MSRSVASFKVFMNWKKKSRIDTVLLFGSITAFKSACLKRCMECLSP